MEHIDQNLLHKYRQQLCTPEEYAEVLEWFSTPDGKNYLETAMAEDLEAPVEAIDVPAALYGRVMNSTLRRRGKLRWLMPLKAAAMIAGVAVLAYILYKQTSKTVYHTAYGEIRTVVLPDQSVVTLNGNSTLRYSNNWEKTREVWVEGETFFSVQKATTPFYVHTASNMRVEVLGTTFNLVARHGRTQVVLNTGKVKLLNEKTQDAIIMQPGDLVEYKQQVRTIVKKNTDTRTYSSWKQDNLQFDNVSFAELAQLLEDTYGVQVEIKDTSLLHQQFTGTIPNRKVDVLLNGLSQLFHLKITQEENKVIIEKQQQ